MTVLDDLSAHIRYLEERAALIPILEDRLEAANRATREARRQLAVSEALRKQPIREDTHRDQRIVHLLATGAPLTQIADEIGMSHDGLKARMQRLYKMHGVNTHSRLVISQVRSGDLDLDDVPGDWVGPAPTPQQQRVLQGVADYGTNKQVGEALGLSGNTVAVHLHKASLLAGTGLKVQLVVRAYKRGWIE